jgi:micrococcal nuclease
MKIKILSLILFLIFLFLASKLTTRPQELEFTTYVVKVIDGDTLQTTNGIIRLSLVNAPEIWEENYEEAKSFVESLCLNKEIFVDVDDLQVKDKYGRWIAKVYCNDINLNEELIKNNLGVIDETFCEKSEFSTESWAVACR